MAYSDYHFNSRGFLFRLKVKFGKFLASCFPLNIVRVWGLRLCGFKVGKKVYIGPGLFIASMNSEDNCNLIIEDRVAIGPQVMLILSSDANWSILNTVYPPVRKTIKICSDAWLGARCIIHPGVTIGFASVIGAGAVVTKDVAEKTFVTGIPAVVKKNIIIK